jgi:hypothetical protein
LQCKMGLRLATPSPDHITMASRSGCLCLCGQCWHLHKDVPACAVRPISVRHSFRHREQRVAWRGVCFVTLADFGPAPLPTTPLGVFLAGHGFTPNGAHWGCGRGTTQGKPGTVGKLGGLFRRA